jgi:hypothetical protein
MQAPGEDHTGILWVNPIAGEADTENAENEPGSVLEFNRLANVASILGDTTY